MSSKTINLPQIILSHLYIAKQMQTNPANAIKFILINRNQFKHISDDMINMLCKENKITQQDLDNVQIDNAVIRKLIEEKLKNQKKK